MSTLRYAALCLAASRSGGLPRHAGDVAIAAGGGRGEKGFWISYTFRFLRITGVVVSWTYNLGEGALQSSTMVKKINAARHEEVPGQMKRWNRAGGKVLKGLERRREAKAALYQLPWY